MTVSQLSIFAESKPGHLARVLGVFEGAQVNVRGFSLADTGEYGITRFIVDKPAAAAEALAREGFAYIETQVVCMKLDDEPGQLARVVAVLGKADLNIVYSYSMISTYIIIGTDDAERARCLLAEAGFSLVTQADIARASAERLSAQG